MIAEKGLVKIAEERLKAIELRFGEGTVKDGMVSIRRLDQWAWKIAGARQLMQRLQEYLYMGKKEKNWKVYDDATVALIMQSPINMDYFLNQEYEIHFRNHEHDKKGKLRKCDAYFVKKSVIYEEVK